MNLTIAKTLYCKKKINRFNKIWEIVSQYESDGCLSIECKNCKELYKIDDNLYECKRSKLVDEAWKIYLDFFPDLIDFASTSYQQKIEKLNNLLH